MFRSQLIDEAIGTGLPRFSIHIFCVLPFSHSGARLSVRPAMALTIYLCLLYWLFIVFASNAVAADDVREPICDASYGQISDSLTVI